MTDKQALLAHADRCEAGTPEQQRALLEEAFWHVFPANVEMVMHGPFTTMLDCGAFVDAALSMMPDVGEYSAGRTHDGRGICEIWLQNGESVCVEASTLALAITAALLRAKAEEVE